MQSFRMERSSGFRSGSTPPGSSSSSDQVTLSLLTQFASEHRAGPAPELRLRDRHESPLLRLGSAPRAGHSVVALHHGIPVKSITLSSSAAWPQIAREPDRPSHEFQIAIGGPLVSAALAAFFRTIGVLTRGSLEGVSSLGLWLGSINLALALFNLIPGVPPGRRARPEGPGLEADRELRAGHERRRRVGQLFAYGFIVYGGWRALTGNFFGGLWIGFIGWFLLNAAQASTAQVSFRRALKGVTAGDVMIHECLEVPGRLSIAELVEHYLLRDGYRCALIVDEERFRGLLTSMRSKRSRATNGSPPPSSRSWSPRRHSRR